MLQIRMKSPGAYVEKAAGFLGCVIQVEVNNACTRQCLNCTRLKAHQDPYNITPAGYATALRSLAGFTGVIGMFGGNPALHPQFPELCEILRREIPNKKQRGLWIENPLSDKHPEYAKIIRDTFWPAHCNINVHGNLRAYEAFKTVLPEFPVLRGSEKGPSMHAPLDVAIQDVIKDPAEMWRTIERCDVAGGLGGWWSASVTEAPDGRVLAYQCEIAQARARRENNWQDGMPAIPGWWRLSYEKFETQIRHWCPRCGFALKLEGQPDNGNVEYASKTNEPLMRRRNSVSLCVVKDLSNLKRSAEATDYLQRRVNQATSNDPIVGLVVSVNRADLLARSIADWKQICDRIYVATSPADKATQELCEASGLTAVVTDVFYRNGANFNKARAMNVAIERINAENHPGWRLMFDADIHPPAALGQLLRKRPLKPGFLYGVTRIDEKQQVIRDQEIAGYFQLYHSTDPRANSIPQFDPLHTHCGFYDTQFQMQWPAGKQVRTGYRVRHYGDRDAGWLGGDPDPIAIRNLYMQNWDNKVRGPNRIPLLTVGVAAHNLAAIAELQRQTSNLKFHRLVDIVQTADLAAFCRLGVVGEYATYVFEYSIPSDFLAKLILAVQDGPDAVQYADGKISLETAAIYGGPKRPYRASREEPSPTTVKQLPR